jgi:hypothetical protein
MKNNNTGIAHAAADNIVLRQQYKIDLAVLLNNSKRLLNMKTGRTMLFKKSRWQVYIMYGLLILLPGTIVTSLCAQNSYASVISLKLNHWGDVYQNGRKVSLKVKNERLSVVLDKIEKQVEYVFK